MVDLSRTDFPFVIGGFNLEVQRVRLFFVTWFFRRRRLIT
jgi:hypothetical protein